MLISARDLGEGREGWEGKGIVIGQPGVQLSMLALQPALPARPRARRLRTKLAAGELWQGRWGLARNARRRRHTPWVHAIRLLSRFAAAPPNLLASLAVTHLLNRNSCAGRNGCIIGIAEGETL